MTDPMNPINPTASNDDATPAGGETTPASEPQVVEVTETFTTTTPQMPDLPPAPSAADQQPTTAMPGYTDPMAQQSAAGAPQYGQPASNPTTQPAADPYAQPAADQYAQPMADPYAQQYSQQQYAQSQYGQAVPGTPAYAPVPAGYVPRNKILAGLLALFFGALGIHNFYLGFTGKAIAQVLLTCLGWILFGLGPLAAIVWSIVEGVQILTSDYGAPAHRDARGVELVD
ncbi:NINE protein [Bifidobacterium pseudolongum]|uniref:TM2 domain-containing protein n=1 Tax=Bifidobacterium pseudolongum TaxID=1694 RepID=UPI0010E3A4F2|nr:TM2 domain-containing protein [Bifidobacterium pseudolongum]MCH4853729.1 NINE protein [Bifidobacterium pseudolongum]RYQ58349.1 TM2 domain-containing protein [Bifidobacterium pseudolongum subsp. globosum]